MEFKKIKLTKDGGLEVHYKGYTRSGAQRYSQEVALVSQMPPHQDLLNAFDSLNYFLADLCEQKDCATETYLTSISADAGIDYHHPDAQKVECRGVTLGGEDESAGICLVGRRKLEGKRILNLVSPFRKWEDPNDGYEHMYLLEQACNILKSEAAEYLKGKYAPSPQGDLFADSETDPVQASEEEQVEA